MATFNLALLIIESKFKREDSSINSKGIFLYVEVEVCEGVLVNAPIIKMFS